jgi:RNA ligase (TIGR02306 family)
MRKLASIRQASNILPIPDADFIELVQVDGWQCVSKKNEFKVNDLGVYFEINSFLPVEDRYEFLRQSSFRKMIDEEGFFLKTSRFRQQISQGLFLPLKMFPELSHCNLGDDVTDILKIQKYESPIPACIAGEVKGVFPAKIMKSDQERIQNLSSYFERYADEEFEVTEKLDGTSQTVYLDNGEFGVCGRNWEYRETSNNSLWQITRTLKLEDILKQLGRNIALQGELVGEGINGNRLKMRGIRFYIYDIIDIDNHKFMLPKDRLEIFNKMVELNPNILHVPILSTEKILQKSMEEILYYANGASVLNPKTLREGVVFKSLNKSITFKAVDNTYLLKNGD